MEKKESGLNPLKQTSAGLSVIRLLKTPASAHLNIIMWILVTENRPWHNLAVIIAVDVAKC